MGTIWKISDKSAMERNKIISDQNGVALIINNMTLL